MDRMPTVANGPVMLLLSVRCLLSRFAFCTFRAALEALDLPSALFYFVMNFFGGFVLEARWRKYKVPAGRTKVTWRWC